MKHLSIVVWLLAIVLSSCTNSSEKKTTDKNEGSAVAEPYKLQQTVYYGGDIITMAGELPTYVEAVVQREGKIIFARYYQDPNQTNHPAQYL